MMPFAGGLESLPNGTLILSAVAAILYLAMLRRALSWRRTMVKTASTALLALLVLIEGGPLLLVAALALSAAGDALLAHEGERPFLGGLAGFLAAHLVYVALFMTTSAGVAIFVTEIWRAALALLALAGAAVMLRLLWPGVGSALRMPVAAYVAAIVAMVSSALTVPSLAVAIGAMLFMASDAILASERFMLSPGSPHRAWAGPAVWVLYYLAQLAITLGFLLPSAAF